MEKMLNTSLLDAGLNLIVVIFQRLGDQILPIVISIQPDPRQEII
jgi:hypothetical protein